MQIVLLAKLLFAPRMGARELETYKKFKYSELAFLYLFLFGILTLLSSFILGEPQFRAISFFIYLPLLLAFAGGVVFSFREVLKKEIDGALVFFVSLTTPLIFAIIEPLIFFFPDLLLLLFSVGFAWSLIVLCKGISEIGGVGLWDALSAYAFSNIISGLIMFLGLAVLLVPCILITIAIGGA